MWFLIPIAIVAVLTVTGAMSSEDNEKDKASKKKKPLHDVLRKNLKRLENEIQQFGEKRIAILGQAGAGKSSLLLYMTNKEVRPLPEIGTETDATNWSKDINCNLISRYKKYCFVDVPGHSTSSHPTKVYLESFPFNQFDGFVFVIKGKFLIGDTQLFSKIKACDKSVCIAVSFSENLDPKERKKKKDDIKKHLNPTEKCSIIFFSNRTKKGLKKVFGIIKKI